MQWLIKFQGPDEQKENLKKRIWVKWPQNVYQIGRFLSIELASSLNTHEQAPSSRFDSAENLIFVQKNLKLLNGSKTPWPPFRVHGPNEPFQPKRRLKKINIHHLIKLGALEFGFMNPFWVVSRSSGKIIWSPDCNIGTSPARSKSILHFKIHKKFWLFFSQKVMFMKTPNRNSDSYKNTAGFPSLGMNHLKSLKRFSRYRARHDSNKYVSKMIWKTGRSLQPCFGQFLRYVTIILRNKTIFSLVDGRDGHESWTRNDQSLDSLQKAKRSWKLCYVTIH